MIPKELTMSNFILKISFFFSLIIFLTQISVSQKVTISGYIKEKGTDEALIGANIFDKLSHKGTIANNFGFYSITFSKGDSVILEYSYTGHKKETKTMVISDNQKIDIYLNAGEKLREVTVTGNLARTQSQGIIEIPVSKLKKLPTISGETDIIKTYQLLPGISAGTEGSTSLIVRGGDPGQNLYLIDDVPVYYINHIGGFFSVFEENAINKVDFYKGGFPSRYGGRLSSIIDIRMKEGNPQNLHGEVKAGFFASKFFIEGPVGKGGKPVFMFSARRCNLDLFLRPIMYIVSRQDEVKTMGGYTFYDINGKIKFDFSEKNKLIFSIYQGDDLIFANSKGKISRYLQYSYDIKSKDKIRWGNTMISARWNHTINNKLFANTTIAATKYRYKITGKLKEEIEETGNKLQDLERSFYSGVWDIIVKTDFDYFLNPSQTIKAGTGATMHYFNPGESKYDEMLLDSIHIVNNFGEEKTTPKEFYVYLQDEIVLGKKFSINAGVRLSGYYPENSSYYSVEPRIIAKWEISPTISFNGTLANTQQFIHLLSSGNGNMPTDIWLPVTNETGPQKSWLYSAGISKIFDNKGIDISCEVFYKEMTGLIDLLDGESFITRQTGWQEKIAKNGKGESYGLELFAKKQIGNTTGWLSYTLSKSTRQFEALNKGNTFPYRFDRRHNFALVAMHKFNDKVSISADWVAMSGQWLTIATGQYNAIDYNSNNNENQSGSGYKSFEEMTEPIFNTAYYYGSKNNVRMPWYHRLDFAINLEKKKKHGLRTWSFGIYNTYSRKNPYFLYYKNKQGAKELYKFCVFPLIPNVSYSYRF